MSNTATIEEIKALTDDALYAVLKQNGLAVGPVLSSTRGIYERKLINYFKENRTSEDTFNQSVADSSITNTNYEQRIPGSPAKKASKYVVSQDVFPSQDDEDIIITHEVKSTQNIKPSSSTSNVNSKTDSLLDFKLLKDDFNYQTNEIIAEQRMPENVYSSYENNSTYSGLNLGNNTPSKSILINRNQGRNQQQQFDSRSRINWASDVGVVQQEATYDNSLYNAPAPPSPFRKEKTVTIKQPVEKVSSSNTFKDKMNILAFFVAVICGIYFFILYLQSYNQENPIQEN